MNEAQEVAGRLLGSGRNPPILLDPIDKSLREVTLLIKMLVISTFCIFKRHKLSKRVAFADRPDFKGVPQHVQLV